MSTYFFIPNRQVWKAQLTCHGEPKDLHLPSFTFGLDPPSSIKQVPKRRQLPTICESEEEFVEDEVDVELSCSGATLEELKDALRLMDKHSRLEVQLDEMVLGDLPSDIFKGLNVVKLDISHCEMDGLPGETALHGLEETIEELVINGIYSYDEDRRTELPPLGHLRRLRELDLSYNTIGEIHDHWFSTPPPSLRHLTLSNNSIWKLGERAFENLVNLESLDLHGNRFGPIKRSMLPRAGNRLENLELDNNAIMSFPDDLFSDMPNLKVLSLANNGFIYLAEKAFKSIWSQLEVFDARGNPLECDSRMEWLFHVKTETSLLLGTCYRPEDKEGLELEEFIEIKELLFYVLFEI